MHVILPRLGIEHYVLDMALLNQLAPCSLTRSDIPVDEMPDAKTPQIVWLKVEICYF